VTSTAKRLKSRNAHEVAAEDRGEQEKEQQLPLIGKDERRYVREAVGECDDDDSDSEAEQNGSQDDVQIQRPGNSRAVVAAAEGRRDLQLHLVDGVEAVDDEQPERDQEEGDVERSRGSEQHEVAEMPPGPAASAPRPIDDVSDVCRGQPPENRVRRLPSWLSPVPTT
jgi:hypothetical protein